MKYVFGVIVGSFVEDVMHDKPFSHKVVVHFLLGVCIGVVLLVF